jgi:hypothetical protein
VDRLEDLELPLRFQEDGYVWPNYNCGVSSYCPYPDHSDFTSSEMFRTVSLGLNKILGSDSETEGYEDKLVIVEVIDILVRRFYMFRVRFVSCLFLPKKLLPDQF